MSQRPLLIVSDAITGPTGMGRITREIAVQIHERMSDSYRVGVAGYGGSYSRKFPFAQYPFYKIENWSIPQLPSIWQDFSGDEEGIIWFIWNGSWLNWFARPETLPGGNLKSFLTQAKFKKWVYAPIDAEGPNGKLPESQRMIFEGFDRVLTYTKFGSEIIARTMKKGDIPYLPHGCDTSIFYPRSRKEARECFVQRVVGKEKGRIADDVLLIGCIATNSPRKDWGLCFETCAELLRRGENVGLWAHSDVFQKSNAWDLLMLADEFGMRERVIFTNSHLDDDAMAWGYAACSVTLGIGAGEGWGMPLSESLAMGIPVITGDYAGATEFVPEEYRVKPVGYHCDGYYGNRRPIFNAHDWANKIMRFREMDAKLDHRYSWEGCWPDWERWLKEGV